MSKRTLYILIAFLLVTNLSIVAAILSNREAYDRGDTDALLNTIITEQLGVNEAQAAEISSIRQSFETDLASAEDQLGVKQEELMNHLMTDRPDMYTVDAIIEEIGTLRTQLQKNAVRRMVQEKQILNQSQQQRYFSEFNTRLGRGQGGPGRGQGYRRGGQQGRGQGRGGMQQFRRN